MTTLAAPIERSRSLAKALGPSSSRDADGLPAPPRFVFRLFVAGGSPRSAWAIRNVQSLCESHLHGSYELTVIDIYQQPELAREAQLVAAPTLVKDFPPPTQRFVGMLSEADRLVACLRVLVAADLAAPKTRRHR
jgi:circadian clock protein KaiB